MCASQDHVTHDGLTGGLVRRPDHGGLGDGRVVHEGRLHLGGGDAVPRDVHDVVYPAQQPEVPVLVDLGPVTGEVAALEAGPVGLQVPLRITPDATQHRRPGPGDREVTTAPGDGLARIVHQLGEHAGNRLACRTRLRGRDARQRRDHVAAGLGLPPGVHDRAGSATDVLVVPDPRLGVDRLAYRPEHAQRRQVVGRRLCLTPLHESADRRRRRVELGHAIALDDVPEPVLRPLSTITGTGTEYRRVRRPLVHDRGAAVGEGPVHDVAVAGHPPDVGRAPVDVLLGSQVERVPVGVGHLREVAAGRVHDALGLRRRTRRVEQVQQLLGVHRLGRAVGRCLGHHVMPPEVASVHHGDIGVAAVHDHHVLHRGSPHLQGGIHVDLQR